MTGRTWRWVISLVIGGVVLAFPVAAHVLVTDGKIGGVLHVTPDDDPIAGEVTSFFIILKDKEGKFQPDLCNCRVVVEKAGEVIFEEPVLSMTEKDGTSEVRFDVTFPEKNIYTVKMVGKPKIEGQFSPFTLTYSLRVARESEHLHDDDSSGQSVWFSVHAIHLAVVLIGSVVAVIMIRRESLKNDSAT